MWSPAFRRIDKNHILRFMSEPVTAEIEALLKEERSFAPSEEFHAKALINDPGI